MRYALLSFGLMALGLLAWRFRVQQQVEETPQAMRLKAYGKYVAEVNEESRRRAALAAERQVS